MILHFEKPDNVLTELSKKYDCSKIHLLRPFLKGAKNKDDRELFYGALFAESLNKITSHEYLIRLPEKDTYCDVELLDHSEYQSNQALPRNQRQPDHFLLQNVQITKHVVISDLKKGNNNIYDIFREHLIRTKLSPRAGDYSGCILVFHGVLTLKEGQLKLQKLRKMVRKINQDKFRQIWIIIPNHDKYSIAELCYSEEQFAIADLEIEN